MIPAHLAWENSMRRILLAGLLGAALIQPASADDVTDNIDSGKQAYAKGDLSRAVQELQFAIAEIQKKQGGDYSKLMPKAPKGWTASEVETQGLAVMGGGISVARDYSQEGGDGTMRAQILSDNPMVQVSAAMLGNPAMLAGQPNMKRVKVGGNDALLEWNKAERSGQVTLLLGGKVLLTVEGDEIDSADTMLALIGGFDLGAVRKLAGG